MHDSDKSVEKTTKKTNAEPVTFVDLVYRRHAFECAGKKLETVDNRLTTDDPDVIEALDGNQHFERT